MFFKVNKFLFQFLATITGSICIISSGMQYGWPSPALPILLSPNSPIKITEEQGAMISTIQEYGTFVGAPLAALIADKWGRKKCIISSVPIFFISWILMAQLKSLLVIYACRFFTGFGSGFVYTALPMYLGEITHPSIRGLTGTLCQAYLNLGFLLVDGLGSVYGLQKVTYIAAFFPVLQLLTFSFMPESPYYSVMVGKLDKAKESLEILNRNEDVSGHLKEIVDTVREKDTAKTNRWEIFTEPSNRKAVFLIFGLRFFQHGTGIFALFSYIQDMFVELDIPLTPSTISIIFFGLQFVVCLFASCIIETTGRKPLLLISLSGSAIAHTILTVYFYTSNHLEGLIKKYLPIAAIFLYITMYSLGLASTQIPLASEMFNTRVKAVASCGLDVFGGILIIVWSYFFALIKNDYIYVAFGTFAVFSVLGTIFVAIFIPETKGMSLEQIQDYLKGKKNVCV